MKFSVIKKDLVEALNILASAVSKNKFTPVLQCVYLNACGSTLELQANSGELGIIAKIPCNAEQNGELLLEAKTLTDFVKDLSRFMAGNSLQ